MSRNKVRKPPSQQNLRNPANRVKKKVAKQKSMSRLRRTSRDYSEGSEPSGSTGTIPIVRGGESGQFIDADGKSYRYADRKQGSKYMKKKLKAKK